MYDPKEIFTEHGYREYLAHLHNIEAGLAFIQNHADDLHIGAKRQGFEDVVLDLYFAFNNIREVLENGDGEKFED